MASCFWRLCLVIAFAMVIARPSATIRTGSPASGWYHEAKPSVDLTKSARTKIAAGDYTAAEEIFARGVRLARERKDPIALARYLSAVAGARRARFEYQGAMKAYQESREIAESAGDWLDLAAVDLNLSGLYEEVWDFDSAWRAAQEGLAVARREPTAYYQPALLLQVVRLSAERLTPQDAIPTLLEAIDSARRNQPLGSTEAQVWSWLGREYLTRGNLVSAEEAFERALYLRRWAAKRDLGWSYLDLGDLRLRRAENCPPGPEREAWLREAEIFTQRAEDEDRRGAVNLESFLLRQQLGRIRLARGDIPGALEELGAAVELASVWRGGVLPSFTSLGGTTAEIEDKVLDEFIETAADYGLKTHNERWISESFLARELSRAANLGSGRALANAIRNRLPPQFWAVLGQLRAEETRLHGAEDAGPQGTSESPAANRLRLELARMEAGAGFGLNFEKSENFRTERSLVHYQKGLRDSVVLLSFHLGVRQSFLWAATRNSLSVYRLPPKDQIGSMAARFRALIETGREMNRPEREQLAGDLYTVLFGQLNPREAGKPEWLISPSDELLQLPFAALMVRGQARRRESVARDQQARRRESVARDQQEEKSYLAELHSVEIASGSPSVSSPSGRNGRFLGVGDPIYNSADSRLATTHAGFWGLGAFWMVHPGEDQLNRLPGSGLEVESSAREWQDSTVLEGANARKQRFKQALNPTPSVIHLATHVLTSRTGTNEAFLAFGLDPRGRPELMGTSEVAMLSVPGSLVVMTGCESAGGDLRAGIGLENLARAWTLAGASAVIATEWPMTDSRGEFLRQFYRNLPGQSPAEALRQTQTAMIHSGGAPNVWASYQIYRGEE
jgi:CHAT domain-containing protein/tetratricopeptide (TPR) repeat protein